MSTFGFGVGLYVTRTKRTAVQLSLGLTVWVKLSLGLNVGGLNVKAPCNLYFANRPSAANMKNPKNLIIGAAKAPRFA